MTSISTAPTLGKDLIQSYVSVEHWKSDLAFYGDELNFLASVINKYFTLFMKDQEMEGIQKLAIRLKYTMQACSELSEQAEALISSLGSFAAKEGKKGDSDMFKTQQMTLEKGIAAFISSYRALKRDIFTITEEILQKEKIKKLLTP